MVVGGLVTHGIDKALEHHHHTYTNSYDDDTELTSEDWNLSAGTSDWDNESSSNYDSSDW